MKAKSIITAVLLIIGLLICFSAAASMDAGASWITGAIRGAVGIIFMTAGAVLGKRSEFYEQTDDCSKYPDDIVEYCEADVTTTQAIYEFFKENGISEQERGDAS